MLPLLIAGVLLAAEPLSEKEIARIVDESESRRADELRMVESSLQGSRTLLAAAKRGRIDATLNVPYEQEPGNSVRPATYVFRSKIAKQDEIERCEKRLAQENAKRDALKKGDKLCLPPVLAYQVFDGQLHRLHGGELVRSHSPTSCVWRFPDVLQGSWRSFKITGLVDLDKTKPEELKLEGLVFRYVGDNTLELVDVSAIEKDLAKLRKRR